MHLPIFYGWIIVAVTFVAMGIGVNARTAFSLLFPPILNEFGWDRGATAGAFSFGFVVSAFFTPTIGRMMDRFGPRSVMELGTVLMAAGFLLAPFTAEPWHLYMTIGVLVGGGSVCLGYSGFSLFLPNWFARGRGLAVGVAFSGVGFGSVTLLPWLQSLIVAAGWRRACVSLGLLILIVLVPINLLLRKCPEDMGLTPDGDAAPVAAGSRSRSNVVDPTWAAVDWTLTRAIRTTRFWWLSLGYFGALYAWYAAQVHQTKYLQEVGFSPNRSAWALGLVSLIGVAGNVALGYLSDRIGREWVWSLSQLGFVICFLALIALSRDPSPFWLWIMVAAQGGLGYGLTSVMGAIVAEIFHGRNFGTIFGTVMIAALGGGAAGPWLTGALHDAQGDYTLAFGLGAAISVISALAIWGTRWQAGLGRLQINASPPM
jgi:MFS family permease